LRYAFISDIHGREAALRHVLRLLDQERIERIVALGDIGNDDCCDLLRSRNVMGVFGNYEVSGHARLSPENQAFVLRLPPALVDDGFVAAHALPSYPAGLFNIADVADHMRRTGLGWRALFPYPSDEDDSLYKIVTELKARGRRLFFHGHTHRQQVWRILDGDRPREVRETHIFPDPSSFYIIGVGSLGQPEDGPAPRYAVYDTGRNEIELRRLTRSGS
jgi:predicted phosphodiesterase